MGDHQCGAALGDRFKRGLDIPLGLGVERRGGFVEHQDRRVLQDCPGDGDALFFAARKLQPALADERVVALGQAVDQTADLCQPRRFDNIRLTRAGPAIADVIADGIVEQHRVLRNDADRRAQGRLRDVAQVLAIDGDPPSGRVIKAEQQPREGRFARARRSDNRHGAARRHGDIDAMQDLPVRRVMEIHRLEADRAAGNTQIRRTRLVLDLRFHVEHIEHALGIDHGLLDFTIDKAEGIERSGQLD